MNNTQIYPFERNRYYPKKRLSSADYTAEQDYFNNKRRFLNGLLYGSGVVCGLGVFSLDDLSVLVESGVAIDGMGREIVVENSDVKKLSSLTGFQELRSENVSLCLRYTEEPTHKVYSIDQSDQGQEFQYNRIREGYELFLMDTEDIPMEFTMDKEFLTQGVLLSSDHYLISFAMPATVSRGRLVKGTVTVEKLTDEDVSLTYHGVLQVPAFITEDGSGEIAVDVQDLRLSMGKSVTFDFWMQATDTSALETNIILKTGTAAGYENDRAIPVPGNFTLKVLLSSQKPQQLVNREIGRMNLEMKNLGGQKDFIRLADIHLVRTDSAYIIETIEEAAAKHYMTAPVQDMQRSDYMTYFVREMGLQTGGTKSTGLIDKKPLFHAEGVLDAPQIATGTVEIPLDENARRGDICYSGEIVHGLGGGNVYVEVGYEYIQEDDSLGENAKSTIYGNPDIFAKSQRTVVHAETAVKVLNDKGSFVVGVRLLENVDYLFLTYRWVAVKFPGGGELGVAEDTTDMSISPETPTVRMGTKENHYFGVRFHNMEKCSLTYELTEPDSGEISADGVYTAPSKTGVYEIRIYCTDKRSVCTYAYAIVEKKGFEQLEAAAESGDKNPLSGMMK